ncbi:GFA family protein, partial [Acinetobacter baumannii]
MQISAEPIAQFWCHCADCQTVHGAAYVAESIYPATGVEIVSGETTNCALKKTPRISCAKCGTRLVVELAEIEMRAI